MSKEAKIEKIAPIVVPTGKSSPSHETVVFGLDKDGGLWKWDSGMTSEEWVQVAKPPRR